MMAFLAVASGAVWGQTYGTPDNPVKIDISFMYGAGSEAPTGDGFTAVKGVGATLHSNTLNITSGGYYKLTGTESNIQITVSATDPVHITVASGIHIDASLDNTVTDPSKDGSDIFEDRCALQINSGAHVTLDWEGNAGTHVEFSSGGYRAGINVKPNATLVLKGTHEAELWGTCWNNQDEVYTSGAGIGGDSVEPDFGTIIIECGTVIGRCFAQVNGWQAYGAGIGGGFKQGNPDAVSNGEGSTEGTIIIKGGTVTGTANYPGNGGNINPTTGRSAAIGGGYKGTCTNIAILGGTVDATTGNLADAIGVGEDYKKNNEKGSITKGIVIGRWDENTDEPQITTTPTGQISKKNIAKGEDGSLVGNVTMPEGTQIYTEHTIASVNQGEKFNAYNIALTDSEITDDGDHNANSENSKIIETAKNYYFGAKTEYESSALTCQDGHLFMGWIKEKDVSDIVPLNVAEKTCLFKIPGTDPNGIEQLSYLSVWVDNDKDILVVSDTNWDEKNAPEISITQDNAISKLEFSFKEGALSEPELSGIDFNGNKLSGIPTLQDGETYFSTNDKGGVKATVKWNTGNITSEQDITLNIAIVKEAFINSVAVTYANNPHMYNGQHHNGFNPNEDDHSLTVKMTSTDRNTPIDPENLTEGVGYRIYSFTVINDDEARPEQASDEDEVPLPIINAGTYSNITIQALNATFGQEFDGKIKDNSLYTLENATITVEKRPMDISITFNKESIEEDEELTWDDVTVTPEALGSQRGIVAKDAEDFKDAVSGSISYTLNEEGTIATVRISGVKVDDKGEFLASNYKLTINGEEYTGGIDDDIIIEVPVDYSSTGGTTDKRYQLFLANKDYLKTDEKTVEYYEDLKLELFSRHNKKYTDAGGSFTIWYEKDGEANVGGYRLFWSKSGEHGDYQEVKFDPVSEYFRIDNVHSDVHVKIYDADGFPVANEAITAQDFRAYAQPNKIIVITPEPTDVQIISMAGAVVAADKVTGQREFANLAEGVYIVRMGETIVKLQVRN